MANLPFHKYQGAGNDFILIDNRQLLFAPDDDLVRLMCHRRFGIGADGLILLQNKKGYDFEMIYFNADGRKSTLCGNGGRCVAAFARQLGIVQNTTTFLATDGPHQAILHDDEWVDLQMGNVEQIEQGEDYFILNTGSPHYVVFVEDLRDINVKETGQAIRYSDRFRKEGINVDFVEIKKDGSLAVATYERGVEAETLSCGTGVTAAAIAAFFKKNNTGAAEIPIFTKGGQLKVRLERDKTGFQNIWLCGPATRVFNGEYPLPFPQN